MLTSQPSGADGFRIEDLLADAAYPHPIAHLKLLQTHISWIVLTGSYAYKIKKPVRYTFIDASSLQRRHFLCEEELRLNRRFAPDLYLDVVPIVRHGGQLKVGGEGEPVEFAVRMHEFDPSHELSTRLSQNTVTAQDMKALAEQIAESHVRAAVATAQGPFGSFGKVRAAMFGNFGLLRTHLGNTRELQLLERLAAWTEDSLTRLEPLIQSRRLSGMVRECHGDLHARNIVHWRQQWLPFDCLEFDPELRWIDVMSDVAFLFMDLMSRQRADLAHEFLSRYLEVTGDYEGLRLLPLYAAYLALVRAKVDALGAETAGPDERQALEARLAERLATAVRFMDAESPALVIMHGVTGSGKSWLSERMISAIPAVRIRSDLERKRLAGVAPTGRRVFDVGKGDYTAASKQRTYQRLLECAGYALDGGRSVIVDATFLEPVHRDMFRALALQQHCRFLIVSCVGDTATLKTRLETRTRENLDPSEATHAVLDEQLRSLQPLTAEDMLQAVDLDTSRPGSANTGLVEIRTRLARAPL